MALVYEYLRKNGIAFTTYNGFPFYRALEQNFKDDGADGDEIIDKLIEAFRAVVGDTVFGPTQYLIDNDKTPWFNLTILSVLASLPEVLGAATEGYIFDANDRRAEKRHNLGMNDYILRDYSNEEKKKWTKLHWKNVRNALAHSITANYVWLEGKGGSHRVDQVKLGNLIAHIDVVRWNREFKTGFDRYICTLNNKNDSSLRRNFKQYITQLDNN